MSEKRIFSGIKPTGDLTLGSYIGAIKNWVELQNEYLCLYCIVDMHAITIRNDPETLREDLLNSLHSMSRQVLIQNVTSYTSRATCRSMLSFLGFWVAKYAWGA